MGTKRIFVVGDSHACFWNGRNDVDDDPGVLRGVTAFRVGPATAHNLMYYHSQTSFGARVIRYLDERRENLGCIVACFGEIDCRVHIVRIAIAENRSIDAVVEDVVSRYLIFIRHLNERYGVPVLMWGPVPSTSPANLSYNPDHPATGTVAERNYATLTFSEVLHRETRSSDQLAHFAIVRELIEPSGMTLAGCLYDGVHLDCRYLGQAVLALKPAMERVGLSHMIGCLNYALPISPGPQLVNIARFAKYTPSSIYEGHLPEPFDGEPNGNFRFHTEKEVNPHTIIDFGSRFIVRRVVLFNRLGEFAGRAASVMIACSVDGRDYVTVWSPDEYRVFGGFDGNPYDIEVSDRRPYRYLKLSLRREEYFHLDLVQVFIPSYDRSLFS